MVCFSLGGNDYCFPLGHIHSIMAPVIKLNKIPIHEAHWYESEEQAKVYADRQHSRWGGHVSPYSVLVAAIGNHWVMEPDCFEAVKKMADYHARKTKAHVCFYEVPDMCKEPYDALGIMRNMAMFRAIDEGFEYLCYVDNDIEPPQETLHKLMGHQMEVMAPRIEFADGNTYGLEMPSSPPNMGIGTCVNVVLSMLLFRTAALLKWRDCGFWENPIGADEAYHFTKLNKVLFFDSNVTVKIHRPPHFPLYNSVERTLADLDKTSLAVKDGQPKNVIEKDLWTPPKR